MTKKTYALWLIVILSSYQKDFYLDDLKEAEAEIERIATEKNELENRLNTLLLQNTSVLSQNNQLNQQLQALQTALDEATISLEEAQELLAEYALQLNLLGGISDGLYKRKKIKLANSLAVLDTMAFTIDDEVFTSYCQIEDSLITF